MFSILWLGGGTLAVGYASASEVIQTLKGDCTEHSVLLVALCRAVGIPARAASGILYVDSWLGEKRVFGGHQWTQVYLDGKWYDVDATLSAPHTSAGRITQSVGSGDADDWSRLINTFGQFEITDVTVLE